MRWSRYFRRRRRDEEVLHELQSYLDIETDENIARGLPPDEAKARARRKLGNAVLVREEIYRMNSIGLLESTWQDLRHGARLLRRSPGFTVVALLSLVLGIGANTAIFQLLDAVRLRTLPVAEPDELAEVKIGAAKGGRTGQFTGRRPNLSNPLWERIRDGQEGFSAIGAWGSTTFDLAFGGESRIAHGLWVSGRFFDTMRVGPAIGRLIGANDDTPGCPAPGAVLSDGFWRREYGGDPAVLGRSVRLDGHPIEIIGVAPASFFGVEVGRTFDIAVPICAKPVINPEEPWLDKPDVWWLAGIGRLKPGWTIERANAQLAAISPVIFEATVPPRYTAADAALYRTFLLQAFPAATGFSGLRGQYGTSLTVLLAIAGLVLLIACANLANLMLARGNARAREIAVRLAIGASRRRIIRQLLSESLQLAVLGAGFGVWLAGALERLLVRFLSSDGTPWSLDLVLDWRVLAFTTALAVVTCLIFGLMPAVRATRTQPGVVMKTSGRGLTMARDRFALRQALVVIQVAISLVLIVGALLFTGTLRNLGAVDPGFKADGVLVAGLDFRPVHLTGEPLVSYQRDVIDRLAAVPGVTRAATAAVVPMSGAHWNQNVVIDGVVQKQRTNFNEVSSGYFETIGTPLITGRNFSTHDGIGSPHVAIVNQAFVRTFLKDGSALGRTFKFEAGPGQPNPVFEIVGVVRNSTYEDLREPLGPIVYLSDTQDADPPTDLPVLLRTSGSPDALKPGVTRVLAELNPGIRVKFQALGTKIRDALLRERLMAALSAGFAALALVLAAVGLYGVTAYTVARRRNEIGIRVALGATRSSIVWMVAHEMLGLLVVGAVAGLGIAVLTARSASALLFGLTPWDPGTLIGATVVLGVAGLLASLVPARRAASLDATSALREE